MRKKSVYQQWKDGERSCEGSFHTALFQAYYVASDDNQLSLANAFPHLFRCHEFSSEDVLIRSQVKAEVENLFITETFRAVIINVALIKDEDVTIKGGVYGRFNLPSLAHSAMKFKENNAEIEGMVIKNLQELLIESMKGGDDESF